MKYINSSYNAACPICSNTQNILLYKIGSKDAARQFLVTQNESKNPLQVAIIEKKLIELWKRDWAAVVRCKKCDFVFAEPFIAGDYEFYNLMPHATGESPENWKWEFEKTFEQITSIVDKKTDITLLEIGASTGDFIKRIAHIIPQKNILCLEHSEIGVTSLRKAGIEAYSWDFHELAQKNEFKNKFDIICLFQVLEHLDRLDDIFATFNTITKPGAHLFIGVPNPKKIKFNELNDALLDLPPNHIGRYNNKSFNYLGNKHGWDIEDLITEPYTALDVMKSVMYYQSLKRAQFPDVNETISYRIKQYIAIKYLRLKSIFMHNQLGEALWVHYKKST
ncbi:MAG: class I SAM-dependent methyltransferase [Mucilaginibacter sp.]